ncbi:MAG TPA: alpha-mannosidase [Chloroflexia bacterium]|nr:alpha-mannosidase [Chloroflexia bacterium]
MNLNLTLAKLKSRIEELERLRYIEKLPLGPIKVEPESGNSFSLKVGERWGKRDRLYRLSFELEIPQKWRGQSLALHLDLSAPANNWTINTVEGLLYLNGKPFHALDRYHREIILPAEATEEAKLDISIRLWSGIAEDYHTATCFELRRLDEAADRLYLRLKLALAALKQLPEDSGTYAALLSGLDEAVLRLDYREGGHSPAFYASCREALQVLEQRLALLEREPGPWHPHITVSGHAHIDVAWLWQYRHTRLKAANTFSTALYHMDRYPYFVFTQSQPQLYAWIKQDQPELYERIRQKVAAGQWEAEGAMWVEADTNITGAESLARQFLFGQRFFKQEFGRTTRVLWLPDVFGYSAALPQLIKAAGADYFITTKISWNETNRIPVDTFWWQGLDGTRVLAYFITAQNSPDENYYTYNAEMNPEVLDLTWKNYRHKELNRELFLCYGWGDGGGGPTREMIEAAGQLAQPVSPDLPTASPGGIAQFMERLEKRLADEPALPDWAGELYLEFHRGTYTSQSRTKRANRLAERDLHNAEWLAETAHALAAQPYPQAELNEAWRQVLTNQFHDVLPGSSIGPVYTDASEIYERVRETTGSVTARAQEALTGEVNALAGSLVAFNSLSWEREGLLEVERDMAERLSLPQQALDDNRALVKVEQVPALGYKAFLPQPASTQSNGNELQVSKDFLENRYYRIELNERGQISRLLDKTALGGLGREVLQAGARGNVFMLFEDKPVQFDAWNIDSYYEQKTWELDNLVSVQVLEQGPLRAGLRLEWLYLDRTRIVQKLYLYAHSRRIDFVTEVDWQERQTLLKVAFPVDVKSGKVTAEVQWGNLERVTHRNTSWDRARFETAAHKWFDLSEGDYGVAVLNDCKYGYDVHGSTLRQTLLRGPISPDPRADLGQHVFTYSLLPHNGGWFAGGVQREAYDLNYPLLCSLKTGPAGSLPASLSLATIEPGNIIIETVKQAEDSEALVLRAYECANRRTPFRLTLPFEVAEAFETNLLEDTESGQPLQIEADGRTISGLFRPYQIRTFLIRKAAR